MGSILDAMVDDFKTRWGDGTNLLEFKYGQSGTGVGQPCGYTSEQIIQFAVDPRMVVLPHIPEEREDEIWDSVKTALTELIEQDLGKAGKGKQVVEDGVDQGPSGGGGGTVRSGVEHFGGGKRAKVGMAAIPECQDSALLAKQEVDTYRTMAGHQFNEGKLDVKANILMWWKVHAVRFPYLSRLARRYLAMPATSASVERLFSVAGQVVTAKRARLDPSTVTLLVFLHEAIPGGIEREAYEIIEGAMCVLSV
jgi:zinc finger BED domain-containing protein 1 (E3 SUMO-protein ligase ZBED1)